MLVCNHCGNQSLDEISGVCTKCGLHSTNRQDFQVDEAALRGLLHNVRVLLAEMPQEGFQQILGLWGPSGTDDGIAFNADDCQQAHRYLLQHGVLCIHVAITADQQTQHSLICAVSQKGLDRALRSARRLANQQRARMEIVLAGNT